MSARRAWRWGAALAALALGAGDAGAASSPLKVYLEPVAAEAVQGLPAEKVEATLRERLGRKKAVLLVPSAEEATLVLRVTECAAWGEKRRVNEADERNIAINPDGRVKNKGGEGVYGVRTQYTTHVLLTVRATWGDRFEDLQAADDDRNLKSAADTVAMALDRLVRHGLRPR